MRAAIVLVSLVFGACQDDVATPFPDGLEPLEDNIVPDGDLAEGLRSRTPSTDPVRVHGRGFIEAAPEVVWELTKQPAAMVARCSTNEQRITPDTEPAYEFSFSVHYVVHDILTVEWDDAWRYGMVTPELGMIRHQKVQGSDFIELSTGTVQVLATDDPAWTEVAFVEHLEAVSGSADDVLAGMRANYDALVALAHGRSIPACP